MVCLLRRATDIHEIERRSHAAYRWAVDANYLYVCNECHSTKLDTMPHAKQLAYKQLADSEHYDLQAWLRVADEDLRAPERVTQEEVNEFCRLIIKESEDASR